MTDKHAADGASPKRNKSHSLSSNGYTLASSAGAADMDHRSSQREVRTLPSKAHSSVDLYDC